MRLITEKALIYLIVFFTISCNTNKDNGQRSQDPNVLILLADDLGYGELGCYGQEIIETPVLDELANQGMRFTQFYAGNAVCSPSRAVLMTGKSSSYSTIRGNSGYFDDHRWMRVALKRDELTIPEMLKKKGYQTAMIGKWHLDDPNDLSTWAFSRGFDYAVQPQWDSRFGGLHFNPHMHWINGMQDSVYYNWREWACQDEFTTSLALDYLDQIDNNKPWFLFMSYRAPHGHERRIGDTLLYSDREWPPQERLHAAKITLLDQQIGILLEKLKEAGDMDNTLIIFTSDNGPHREGDGHDHEFFNSNGALKGFKRDLYEGGIRVPMIAVWAGRIRPGTTSHYISGFQDLMPTLAGIAGVEIPDQCNGLSFLPVLTGKVEIERPFLNWEFQRDGWWQSLPEGGFRQAVRIGKWKAVRYGLNSTMELYDLESDLSESVDLATENPEIVDQALKIFEHSRTETPGFPYGGVK